ncbi:DUF4230 domain-containing protein [Sphingobium sp.]|uniref:DUF4230 domain-containing protein n=1 Tax=Sphingobium sp. TaxID=1912891 RepID=UPI002621FC6C|nr:DUF4230 domain-containing protein [Sphingobium sp.]
MKAAVKWGVGAALAAAALWLGYGEWQRHRQQAEVTVEPDETAITRIVAAKMSAAASLKVSGLSGTIQSTAKDVRWGGWLQSVQVVKMPFSVDYFIDLQKFGPDDVEWNPQTHTLIVDAPDVRPAAPNIDESRPTLVMTKGMFVTREASQQLARKVSVHARDKAQAEAQSFQRMETARRNGRAALSRLLAQPLIAAGYRDARVIITFPPERVAQEQWDVTTPINEVLANRRQQR